MGEGQGGSVDKTKVEIRLFEPADWAAFRQVRLRGLADTPEAFGTTFAEAQARTERDWRCALTDRVQYVATTEGVDIGTVGGMRDEKRGGVHLISMWVAPEARGTGVADLLVRAVIDWANEIAVPAVWLEVAGWNEIAERLYVRHGFVRTGVVGTISPNDPRPEFEMLLRL